MLKAIICLVLSALLLKHQYKKLMTFKDKVVLVSSFLFATGLLVSFFLDYSLPSITKVLEFVYQPLANQLYDFLQQQKAG